MGRIVIAGYKPKPGKEKELDELMTSHVSKLRAEGFVTEREPILMKASNGTVFEVFEWKSKEAIEAAHSNKVVGEMWSRFAEVCEYVPITSVDEAHSLFPGFEPSN